MDLKNISGWPPSLFERGWSKVHESTEKTLTGKKRRSFLAWTGLLVLLLQKFLTTHTTHLPPRPHSAHTHTTHLRPRPNRFCDVRRLENPFTISGLDFLYVAYERRTRKKRGSKLTCIVKAVPHDDGGTYPVPDTPCSSGMSFYCLNMLYDFICSK